MEPIRVALIGPAGSGKTTHARLLQKALKGDVLSFASPMKKILREVFGERMDDPTFAREAAQQFGTNFVRRLDVNTWVRLLLEKVPDNRNSFVDDCRFANEWVALDQLGFRFIRLTASAMELQNRRPDMTPERWQHESEIASAALVCERTFATDLDEPEATNARIRAYLRETPYVPFRRAGAATATVVPH